VISPSQRPLPAQDNTTCKHKRQTSMPREGFEPATPATKRPKTYALDRAATGISLLPLHHHHHHHHWLDSPTWALAFLRSFCQLKLSGYCFFRFRDKSVVQGGVVSSKPNPRLSRRALLPVHHHMVLQTKSGPSLPTLLPPFLPISRSCLPIPYF
jgi:hypothetical protein